MEKEHFHVIGISLSFNKQRTNRIFKETGLYTIVTPSTSLHPTPLKRRYEGYLNYPGSTFCSNITLAVAKYASRCALVQVKISSSGLACKVPISELLTYCFDPS